MSAYEVSDVADWVVHRRFNRETFNQYSAPSVFALVDYQNRVSDRGIERYCRTVEWVFDESRIEDASLLIHELNEQQHVVFHFIKVLRDGNEIDALDSDHFAINERQRGLEAHVVDGVCTISYSIEDLRLGDGIDYAYTIITTASEHPVFGKYYLSNNWLNWGFPVDAQLVRLVNDSKLPITRYLGRYYTKKYVTHHDSILPGEKYELASKDLPITQIPQSAPDWFWPDFFCMATECSWTEISRDISLHLKSKGVWQDLPDLTEFHVLSEQSQTQQIVGMLRFVQNEIRYRSESRGIFSHTPKQANRTLAVRYGDCKDKAALLKIMLKQIGIASDLVLVSSDLGRKVVHLPPSPMWFDHMILRLHYENKVYYLDPTIKKQGGDLMHMADLPYGYVLPLTEEGSDLSQVPRDTQALVMYLHHRVDFSYQEREEYYLEIRRVFYLHRADNMRFYLSSKSAELLANEYLGYATEEIGLSLQTDTAIRVEEDDLVQNRLETFERYIILGLGKEDDNKPLQIPTEHYRNFPISNSLEYPIESELDGRLVHEIDVYYRVGGTAVSETKKIQNKWFSYQDQVTSDNNSCHYRTETRPLQSLVPADQLQEYMDDVDVVRQRSTNSFPFKTHQVGWMDRAAGAFGWGAGLMVFVLIIILTIGFR